MRGDEPRSAHRWRLAWPARAVRGVLGRVRYPVGMTLLAALTGVVLAASPAVAQKDGANDNSFWADGTRALAPLAHALSPRGLTVMQDGLLVYGAAWSDAGVWYSTWQAVGDSALGLVCTIDLPGYEGFSISDVAADAQGRLVVLGFAAVDGFDTPNIPFVARYLYPACTLDGTFDQDGWTLLSWASEFASVAPVRLMVQADGKLMLAGNGYFSGSIVPTPIAFRLLPAGGLDTSFSSDGRTHAPFESGYFTSAAVTPGGKLLMTFLGQGGNRDFALALFDANGAYVVNASTPFDLVPNGSDSATSVTVGADSTIYVSGWVQGPSGTRVGVVSFRFLPNGFLVRNNDFGGDGRVDFVLAPETYSQARSSLVQGDGKLLVVGRASNSSTEDGAMAVARLLPSGSLDPEFFPTSFTHGLRLVEFDLGGTNEDTAAEVLLQRGRIVLGGSATRDSGDLAVALARLHNALLLADAFETGDARYWATSP